jgi:hypothetical protein
MHTQQRVCEQEASSGGSCMEVEVEVVGMVSRWH